MDPDGKNEYRQIGWNGFRISVPREWDAERIGEKYVLLGNDGVPALEAKWDVVKGGSNPEKALERLKKSIPPGKRRRSLQPCSVPARWADALHTFRHAGFQWQGERYSGRGVLACCPECGRTTVLQFFEANETSPPKRDPVDYPTVLSSFADHPVDGQRLWSVFDIRLLLPENCRLVRHSFAPGAFRIEFDADSLRMSFFRWGPASVILDETSLDAFVGNTMGLGADGVKFEFQGDDIRCEFKSIPPQSSFKRWLWKLRKKPSYQWGRAWRPSGSNRILAVKAQSCGRFDSSVPESICDHYSTLTTRSDS